MKWITYVMLCCCCLFVVPQAHGFTLLAPGSAETVTVDNGVQVWNYRSDYVYSGLPEPLQGIPGIRFQGNTSSTESISDFVQIELHETNDVYIFWWNDYAYPNWLQDMFEVTEWQCLMGGYTFNILHARLDEGIHSFGVTNDTNWRDWYGFAANPVDEEVDEVFSVNLIQSPSIPQEGNQVALIAEVWNPTGTVSFAWYFNDALIHDATESMLTLHSVTGSDMGVYRVEVTDESTTVVDELHLTIYETLPLSTTFSISMLVLLMILVMSIQWNKSRFRN